jgi:HK97 gp10 family phage protein
VEGLRQLGERMRKLSKDVAIKDARASTAAGAQVVKKAVQGKVRSNPSIDTGSLLASVIVKRLPKRDTTLTSEHIVTFRGRGKVSKKTGVKQAEAPHARHIEFGTVNMAAEPVLRPGFDQSKQQALDAMVKKLDERLKKSGA